MPQSKHFKNANRRAEGAERLTDKPNSELMDNIHQAYEAEEAPPSPPTQPSEVDMAAQLIVRARDTFQRAMRLLPDCREKSTAITYHDTSLLWLNQAMTIAKQAEFNRKMELAAAMHGDKEQTEPV